MKQGDQFIWLHRESDAHFGERCEIIQIRDTLVDYKFIDHPNWKTATMPLSWIEPKKYTEEQIKAIRMRQRRRRWRALRV
jgi:hypothetical protein